MRVFAVVIAAALVACGDDQPGGPDADAGTADAAPAKPKACWPDAIRMPKGSAVLGTGRNGFEAMPDVLPLEYGMQAGFNLLAHVRMTGLTPGNPRDLFDPSNPRTRIRAYFADTPLPVPLNYYAHCPFRSAYVASDGGGYELVEAVPVIFETCWRSEHLFGKRIRIELEILDDSGGYTTDVKFVTAAPPTSEYAIDMGTPGCSLLPGAAPPSPEP